MDGGSGIPDGITREDVLQAFRDYDNGVAHPFGPSTRYDVVHEDQEYPPKAIVGLAARRIAGRVLQPTELKGGDGSNNVLRELGFEVVSKIGEAVGPGPTAGKLAPPTGDWLARLWGQFRRLVPTDESIHLPVYWAGNLDRRLVTTLVGKQLHVEVTPSAIEELEAIPEDYAEGLAREKNKAYWLRSADKLREHRGKTVTLNCYTTAVVVPRELPHYTAAHVSVYSWFHVIPEEISGLFTGDQLDLLREHMQKKGAETIKIRELGKLFFPASGPDRPEEVEIDDGETWLEHRNVIFFGPPGTGKSYQLKEVVKEHLKAAPGRVLRVTFHPEFSYYDLVGSFRPAVGWIKTSASFTDALGRISDREPRTYYHFEPGALTRALKLAAESPDDSVVLVIEEINRGNCAAIFGDVFQLLDRVRSADPLKNGWSEYSIQPSAEWAGWLAENLPADSRVFDRASGALRLPGNLYLYATMNTSDQSLYPMDTAFRRRWGMEYFGVDGGGDPAVRVPLHAADQEGVVWLELMAALNARIVDHTRTDDKQLGPYYVRPPIGQTLVDAVEFKSKVLFYLWSAVFRDNPQLLFQPKLRTYESVVERYKSGGHVFNERLLEVLGLAVVQAPESSGE